MTSRVSSKNKEKRPKEKIVKKKRLNRKKKTGQRNKKQRRRESNPVYLHVQATLSCLKLVELDLS